MLKQSTKFVLSLFFLTTLAVGQTRKPYVDQTLGYSIKAPTGFTRVPMRGGEKWILSKFLADKTYRHVLVQDGRRNLLPHRPTLRVMAFPRDVETVKVKTDTKKTKGGDMTINRYTISNPYKNYKDYLNRHHQGGGWHISKLEEIKVGGVNASWTEVEVRALTNLPKDLIALVYHLEDRDIVIEFDVLPSARAKLENRIKNSLKSVRFFTPSEKADEKTDDPGLDLEADSKLSPEERNQKMAEHFAKRARIRRMRELERARKDKPKGWRAFERKNFVVLTHVGDKYTRHILNQAGYVRKWLDRRFSKLGDGKVYPSLIRIFKGTTEANAYLKGSGDSFFYETGEVVCGGEASSILSDFDRIATGLLHQYLSEKNPALWNALPFWLRHGLDSYVGSAFPSKKVGLIFRRPHNTFAEGIKMCKADNLPAIRDIMRSEWDSEITEDDSQRWTVAAELFVRYLLEKGKKGKTKKLLPRWMDMSLDVLNKMDGEFWDKISSKRDAEAPPEPLTEEEEDAAFLDRKKKAKDFRNHFAQERRKLLADSFTKTFAGWKEKDWKKLQKSFAFWIKSGGR
ncbi:MAG: hypothetical protein ACI97A_000714 [Planctomycetota bacterium]|jgi:hypothetical protein